MLRLYDDFTQLDSTSDFNPFETQTPQVNPLWYLSSLASWRLMIYIFRNFRPLFMFFISLGIGATPPALCVQRVYFGVASAVSI